MAPVSRPAVTFSDHDAPPKLKRTKDYNLDPTIIMKERMLIRAEWTPREDLPDNFDEQSARKYKTQHQGWEECAVVWRPGRLELWSEYSLPLASFLLGHKKLLDVIPLTSRTSLSLYSSPDSIFSLLHRPSHLSLLSSATRKLKTSSSKTHPHSKHHLHFHRTGTSIYLVRARSARIAKEWYWNLFNALGGQWPTRVEIDVVELGAKINLPVPRLETEETANEERERRTRAPMASAPLERGDDVYFTAQETTVASLKLKAKEKLSEENVVRVCMEALETVPDWKEVVDQARRDGTEIRLAWRRGEVLDWVEKGARDVEVVKGYALAQASIETSLEIRSALHYPNSVPAPHSATTAPSFSSAIPEPPSIEGFLNRLNNAATKTTERMYLSVHSGKLFLLKPSTVIPPSAIDVESSVDSVEFQVSLEGKEGERRNSRHEETRVVLGPFLFGLKGVVWKDKNRKSRRRKGVEGMEEGRKLVRGQGETERDVEEVQEKEENAEELESNLPVPQSTPVDSQRRTTSSNGATRDKTRKGEQEQATEKRTFEHITRAIGFVDLCDIVAVARESAEDDEALRDVVDAGGDGGYADAPTVEAKEELRKRRSFVLLTKSGVAVTFECWSISLASLWINSLSSLRTYWIRRTRLDAIEQMSLHGTQSAPSTSSPAQVFDRTSSSLLGKRYNLCISQCCRGFHHAGRVYVKTGLRGAFNQRYCFLVPGLFLQFNRSQTVNGNGRGYHKRIEAVSLRGVYIFSGRLCSEVMRSAQGQRADDNWDPALGEEHFGRVFSDTDGLISRDGWEDCTIVLFKKVGEKRGLGRKGKIIVLRTRSRVERDEWLYALNIAIEQLQGGVDKDREDMLKEFSWLKNT